MARAPIATRAGGGRASRRRLVVIAAAGAALLLGAVGSAFATRPSASLPPSLPEAEQVRLRQVTEHASVSARSNGDAFRLRQDVFEYMLDHLEFATHVIRALGIGRYRIWREPDGLWLNDGGGALVRFQVVYAAQGSRIFYLQGHYQPAVLPTIYGRVVVLLEYTVEPMADGKSVITPAMASFVRIDNAVIGMLARLFTAVVAPRATRVTQRMVVDIARTARAIDDDPVRVTSTLRARPDVPPRELAEFDRLLAGR